MAFVNFIKKHMWSIIAIAIGVLILVIDIITKQLIMNHFETPTTAATSIVLIPGFLRISYVQNFNAAFGFGFGTPLTNRIVYICIASIGFIALIGFFIWKNKKLAPIYKICIMMIAAGAIGNLIDRIFYGPDYAVVDWIDFYGIWPFVFNIADTGVVIGALLMAALLIVEEVKDYLKKRKLEAATENDASKGKILSKEEQSRLSERQSSAEQIEEIKEDKE